MKQLLIILFIFLTFVSNGQAKIKEIREIHYNHHNKIIYIFPSVDVPNKPMVSEKINDQLVLKVLDIPKGKKRKSIFENVWGTKDLMPQLTDLSYKLISNNVNFLSISISALGCGAYCEDFTIYFSFDLKNGNEINIGQLFIKEGQQLIVDSTNFIKIKKIKAKLIECKDSLDAKSNNKEYFEEMRDLYEACLLRSKEPQSSEDLLFYIAKTKFYLAFERCSSHADRNADELDPIEFLFDIKDWKKYLSPYGLKLFSFK